MKTKNPVLLVVLVTPLIVAPLVLLGVYLGFYAGSASGYSGSILAIVFSTIGFLAAIFIVLKVIVAIVARSEPRDGASSEPQPSRSRPFLSHR